MPCADCTNANLQNAYFEGYTQAVEVTKLFVFNCFGELIHAAVNYPGSWHDTKLAAVSGLYYPKLLDEFTKPGMALLGDSAFVNNVRVTHGKILRGRKSNEMHETPCSNSLAAIDIILQSFMLSERQTAEWGSHVKRAITKVESPPLCRFNNPTSFTNAMLPSS